MVGVARSSSWSGRRMTGGGVESLKRLGRSFWDAAVSATYPARGFPPASPARPTQERVSCTSHRFFLFFFFHAEAYAYRVGS